MTFNGSWYLLPFFLFLILKIGLGEFMKIAVASGKGGTGKTFLATNLFYVLSEVNEQVTLLDCDVEEPNSSLFIKPNITETIAFKQSVPLIDQDKCIGCRKCSDNCQFNALITIKSKTYVYDDMCHSCGLCMRICPTGAITKKEKQVGVITKGDLGSGIFVEGRTDIGTELSSSLVSEVKKYSNTKGIVIIDAPPGTSCNVVETVKDCDYVILVTEPTPFGLNDLKLAVELMNKLKLPFGVAVNRMISGTGIVGDYCEENGFDIIFKMELDRSVAESYSEGHLVVRDIPVYRQKFISLVSEIKNRCSL